jgi:hypothetical protein
VGQPYPNPSNGRFYLDVFNNSHQKADITIYDGLMQLIQRNSIELADGLNTLHFNIAQHASEAYRIIVVLDDRTVVERQVIHTRTQR